MPVKLKINYYSLLILEHNLISLWNLHFTINKKNKIFTLYGEVRRTWH